VKHALLLAVDGVVKTSAAHVMKPQSPQLAENTVPAQSIITAELNSGEKLFQAIKDLQKQAQHA
jgi:hypothetical protein